MVLGLGGDTGFLGILLNVLVFAAFFMFVLPRIMLAHIKSKAQGAADLLETNAEEAEQLFLNGVTPQPTEGMRERMKPMKNMVLSPPTDLDPAGIVPKLEQLLDFSDDKMERFVEELADRELEDEELNDLSMAFKGVYGCQQIYVITRHFKELIEKSGNFLLSYQLGQMLQMVLPFYEEIAEAQRDATEAFVNGVPIGDAVGPMVAASFVEETEEPEEAAEDVITAEEEVEDTTVHVVKSKGPGARLGKYGEAIEQVIADNDIERILFVDAGMRYEGEETGTVVDGAGVMMGGPGVEKFKIEEIAEEHDIPLDGMIIKQTAAQASQPMHSKIYDAVPEAVDRAKQILAGDEDAVMLVGVGNTCGIGNTKDSLTDVPTKLKPYWAEEEEDQTSYAGLMKMFSPAGGQQPVSRPDAFQIIRGLIR